MQLYKSFYEILINVLKMTQSGRNILPQKHKISVVFGGI